MLTEQLKPRDTPFQGGRHGRIQNAKPRWLLSLTDWNATPKSSWHC